MNHLIDTHCHLLKEYYNEDIADILNRAKLNNVIRVINISTAPSSIEEVVNSYKEFGEIFGAIGLHPQEAETEEAPIELLEKHARDLKVVAIGEIGFDLYRKNNPELIMKQKFAFHNQMKIAEKHKLPVIIHSRGATDITMQEISKYPKTKKVIHCFSENLEVMNKYLRIPNTYISFTGIVTFNNAKNVQEAFLNCPEDKFMLETDSPYLSPAPRRGKKNEPAYVNDIAKYLAKLKDVEYSEIVRNSTTNAYTFFDKLY